MVYNADGPSSCLLQRAMDALPGIAFDVTNATGPVRPVTSADKRVDVTVHGDQTLHTLLSELGVDEIPAGERNCATLNKEII